MPDEVTAEHSDVAQEGTNGTAPDERRRKLIRELTDKQAMTVLSLTEFITGETPFDPGPTLLVLDLLPPMSAGLFANVLKGGIAAAVATLRAAEIQIAEIESWLGKEIAARRSRFVLGFTASQAVHWFHDCMEKTASSPMIETFKSLCPDPLEPLAENSAKRRAADILDTVCLLNAKPLARKRRSRS
jgi:hypothetical protein